MKRRRFLTLAGASLVAGCGGSGGDAGSDGGGDPAPSPTPAPDTATPTVDPDMIDAAGELGLLSTIQDAGVDVKGTERDGDVYYLAYYGSVREADIASEIGSIAGAYAGVVDNGWEVQRLNVLVYRSDDTVAAVYYIQAAWAQSFMDGDLSRGEYLSRVTSTVTIKD